MRRSSAAVLRSALTRSSRTGLKLAGPSRCFASKSEGQAQPKEKARPFDHRTIGQAQRLFFTHESSPGTPFMLPHGVRVCAKVERVIRDLYRKYGYEEVVTPQIFKADLWKQSGHWENYRDDMFAVEGFKEVQERNAGCCGGSHESPVEGAEAYGLKPMNCPGHCVMFNAQEHSYRDLPIRYAEFSSLHRNEPSGSLTGLTRVRRFHQDDAHIFCRPDQISEEISTMLEMLKTAYQTFGFPKFELVLSTRPSNYLGEVQDWDRAEEGLRVALKESGMKWKLNEADGAFYGPKIDIRLVDSSGKRHQTATIQLDFQLPKRFDLQYDDPNAPSEKGRPVMIHRAILGSMERFLAILIEHTSGNWPFWLSPRQAIVIPVSTQSQEMVEYAIKVSQALSLNQSLENSDTIESKGRNNHYFHVDVDSSEETLSKRIRRAQVARYSFICVVGEEEMQNKTVNLRTRQADQDSSEVETGRPVLKKDMGAWSIPDLRKLFITLDDNHW
jgi:threonyl-tRNA synthetase